MKNVSTRRFINVIGIAIIYYFSARLGLALALGNTNASPVWPPSGFAFAAIILLGYRTWPGIFIGALAANIAVFMTNHAADIPTILTMSAFIAAGNTLEALAGHYLLNLFRSRQILYRSRDFTFFVLAALLMCTVSCSIGTTSLFFGKIVDVHAWKQVWFTWWMGDVSGIIVLTPVLLSCFYSFRRGINLKMIPRFLIIFSLLIVSCEAIFMGWMNFIPGNTAAYLLLVVMAWCVFSIEQWQSSFMVLLVAALSIWNTLQGNGPFVSVSQNESLLSLQMFLCVSAITMMFLSTSVNQRRRTEERLQFVNLKLEKAKKQLEETMKVKENFLASMSHEIRTPMNAIVGFTELLEETGLDSEQQQYVGAVKRSGENLLVIINDILDFSKLRSGKIVFEQTAMRLSLIMASVKSLMQPKASQKGVQFSVHIDSNVPDELLGDPTRLSQILINLIDNAIKFTEEGNVEVFVRMIESEARMVSLQFEVRDNGIGIPPDKIEKVFDGFTQASNETTRKYGGTGLGLAIVKELVELQNGTISLQSKLNSGSVFQFTLTFRKDPHHHHAKDAVDSYESDQLLKGKRILLVEDNELNQLLLRKILDDLACNVQMTDNGDDAIIRAKENDFDLILMDIQLPGMDGFETTKWIRKKSAGIRSQVPILAVTAHAMIGQEQRCLQAGMNGYISKPFSKKALYRKMIEAMFDSQRIVRRKV
ncbi:MAG TPA: MASE1 domain-containing protein [Bacteroidia bacterium]|jgi:signal transduction histidine kinase/ActR/RegA family two-component response regulator|nr:MASE1 domain-containing protein [Bacteroidia bacterium]